MSCPYLCQSCKEGESLRPFMRDTYSNASSEVQHEVPNSNSSSCTEFSLCSQVPGRFWINIQFSSRLLTMQAHHSR